MYDTTWGGFEKSRAEKNPYRAFRQGWDPRKGRDQDRLRRKVVHSVKTGDQEATAGRGGRTFGEENSPLFLKEKEGACSGKKSERRAVRVSSPGD